MSKEVQATAILRTYDNQVLGTQIKHAALMALKAFRREYRYEANLNRTTIVITFDESDAVITAVLSEADEIGEVDDNGNRHDTQVP